MSYSSSSIDLFTRAQAVIPGGVNSPVRAFRSVAMDHPPFIERGEGAYLFDVSGKSYIDYVLSWGPLILGHAHPHVLREVAKALSRGTTFGAPTEVEVLLAEKVVSFFPSMEKVRFVSSGTEACMSAIRLARGVTKRHKIVKFIGCYHGHADALLVQAGSGLLTYGVPSSKGVTDGACQDTLLAPYNDLNAVRELFEKHGTDIAAIILEPVAGNMNLVLPVKGFLSGLRTLCDAYGSLLIFDEVITGWRVHPNGAQALYGIKPDLTVLGKIVGGGFPAAAFGGSQAIMDQLAPLGPVYQAGTLSGNPIAMTAGLATLEILSEQDWYEPLSRRTAWLAAALQDAADRFNIPFQAYSVGGMFGLFFTRQEPILQEEDVLSADLQLFQQFFQGMLQRGIYLAPSAFEVGFLSIMHTDADLERTVNAASEVFSILRLS